MGGKPNCKFLLAAGHVAGRYAVIGVILAISLVGVGETAHIATSFRRGAGVSVGGRASRVGNSRGRKVRAYNFHLRNEDKVGVVGSYEALSVGNQLG